MPRGNRIRTGALAGLLWLFAGTLNAADISGEVRVEGDADLRRLVVYLEPVSVPSTSRAPVSTRIFQRGREFAPGIVAVVQGESVEFVNDEDREIDHNVYSLSRGNSFDVGLVPRGKSREVIFHAPGVVKYFCSVHKLMEGAVMVVPSRHFTLLDRPGAFTIRNVPPGTWRVGAMATHRRYRDDSVQIVVGEAPVTDVRVWMRRRH
jgi:plastocyanin